MKKTIKFPIVLLLLLASTIGHAQGLKIGDKAIDFKLKNVDGDLVSLPTDKSIKGVIIIFTCNNCPFSIAYEDRIIALHDKYAALGFPVIAINPNDAERVPEDSFRNMKKRAREKGFKFSYLHDETQETAKAYGATRTPHVFLTSRNGSGEYVVSYIGAIDNNTDDPAAADKKYIESAISEILEGKAVSVNATKAIGCSIKWKQTK
ncbi:MAG: thioredoxin family protein [Bacteroidota bacterium]